MATSSINDPCSFAPESGRLRILSQGQHIVHLEAADCEERYTTLHGFCDGEAAKDAGHGVD